MPNYADFQIGLYFAGLGGQLPAYPLTFADLESAAQAQMEHRLLGLRLRRRGRRAHAARQRRGVRPLGRPSADAVGRRRARPVRRAVRPHLPDPALHGADRRARCDDRRRARRPRRRPGRGRVRRPDWSARRSCRTRWRTSPPSSATPPASSSSTRPTTASWPRAWCVERRQPGTPASSSPSTPGRWATGRATSSTRRSRSCAATAWPTTSPTRCSAPASRRRPRRTRAPRPSTGR